MISRLRLSIYKTFLHWWIECTEKDANSALPTYYYTAHVELVEDTVAWCEENLTGTPTFEECAFDTCEDCFTLPTIPVENLYLIFKNDQDATHFLLRWC